MDTETGGSREQQHFAGLTLTMTHEGVVKKYTFARDIFTFPHQKILIATAPGVPWDRFDEFFGESLCPPDFVIPYRFVATDGGTIDFAGTDQITYTSLPTDGTQSLYYIPPFEGESHFFSAFPGECSQVGVRHPEYVRESDAAFYVALPDPTTGACNGFLPVYRLWNQHSDSNHRYTTNVFIRNLLLQRGYASEGYGPDGVAFCVEAGGYGIPSPVGNTVVEYYNAEHDHYFITAVGAEIDALDSERLPGWQRTGWTFSASPIPSLDLGLTQPMCRFYIAASDDHFFSASTAECTQIAVQHPEYVRELGTQFYVSPADMATGTCARDFELIPVFRVRRPDPDVGQRFTTNVFIRNLMIQQGYVADGFGPNGVAFCVPGVDVSP